MISPDINIKERTNVDVEVTDCQCGELALTFTGQFVSWERCGTCTNGRLLAWTSCQVSTLVLNAPSPGAANPWRPSLHA